jgi:hypothetical protein
MKIRAAALCHEGVVGELTAHHAVVSCTAELVFGRSPKRASWEEVMNELTDKL